MQPGIIGLGRIGENMVCRALDTRFRSRQTHPFAKKILSAMRQLFGGHIERATGG